MASILEDSFVIVPKADNKTETASNKEAKVIQTDPSIFKMLIESKVRNRFAHTIVTSKVRNLNSSAKEATFSVILPEKAFISEFVMIIGEKSYKAHVKKKEEAQLIYNEAVERGTAAAQVAASARDSNRFGISVNVEPLSTATFILTYEELLQRKDNMYELIVNVHPKEQVEDLLVNVLIDESRPLKFVRVPALRSGQEIAEKEGDLDPKAQINQFGPTSAVVRFKPSVERQKEIATIFGSKVEEGFAGQFVVQYDVERDPNGGEVLVQDGYFIHFFAPEDIKPLNKHIIFVLDISTSMTGQKLDQLKQAMNTILQQLDEEDYFHVISFESGVEICDLQKSMMTSASQLFWDEESIDISNCSLPPASPAIRDNILKAKKLLGELAAHGCTNIYDALRLALILIQREKHSGVHENLPQPMIMFLTDGEPTFGRTNKRLIFSDITKFNEEKVSIFTLSFGEDADKTFLKKLAQKNHAFSRHIYEASDAALQLQNFYKEIASPLLSDVKFEYMPDTTSLTKTTFPLHFDGGEIVVSGRLGGENFLEVPNVKCLGRNGLVVLHPKIERPVTSLERLWAYLTVRQLLDECETAENKTIIEQNALDLALRYSFVTSLTSLVVVKPDSDDSSVDLESASKGTRVEELPEMATDVVKMKKVLKKRVIKKKKSRALDRVECVEIETVETQTKKCNRAFLWTLARRFLCTGATFRISFFVSLFFYFLIMTWNVSVRSEGFS